MYKFKNANTRIAANTIATYGRTIIGIFLVLFGNRWTLSALGVDDFGLFNVIGSIMAIVVFLNAVLASSDARYFAVAIGKGDKEELTKVFNVFLSLHILIPILILLAGTFLGEWIIKEILVIPDERVEVALKVFEITMVSSFLSMISIPFSSLFIAYQNIIEYTIINLLQSALLFLSAYLLRFSFITDDKLLLYSILVSLSYALSYFVMIIISVKKYDCVRIVRRYLWEKRMSLEVLKYSFWNMMGDVGHLVRTQGIAIVVNLFWGTKGNAALGIANQVSIQASNLTNAMATSISPEIYRRVGEGDKSALYLSDYASRLGLMLILILGVPLIYNIEGILTLWLKTVPEGADILCVCFIIMFIIEKISLGQLFFLKALGNVALVNVLIFVFYSMSLVFPYMGLSKLGLVGIGISCIFSMLLSRLSVIYCISKYPEFSLRYFILRTLCPTSMAIVVIVYGYYLTDTTVDSIFELVVTMMTTFVLTTIATFLVFFNTAERHKIQNLLWKRIKK